MIEPYFCIVGQPTRNLASPTCSLRPSDNERSIQRRILRLGRRFFVAAERGVGERQKPNEHVQAVVRTYLTF